jgi:hypothetical protein
VTRDVLFLTENPPKRLSAPLPLCSITRITIGRALPSFLPRDIAEKTQQIIITYRAGPGNTLGAKGGQRTSRSPLNSTSGNPSHEQRATHSSVKAEPGHLFSHNGGNSGSRQGSASAFSHSFDGSEPASPSFRNGPRGSIDISAALEAASLTAAGAARGGMTLARDTSLPASRNSSVVDLRAMEDSHRLSLSPLGNGSTLPASAPVSPRWSRREKGDEIASAMDASPSARSGSRGLLSYFHRGSGTSGSTSSLGTRAVGASDRRVSLVEDGGASDPASLAQSRSPPPAESAVLELSLFTMVTHPRLMPCLQEAWRAALVRQTLRDVDDATEAEHEPPTATETRFRRACRTALSASATAAARLEALERCCSSLKAHLPCCRAFLRDTDVVTAALAEINSLLTSGPAAGDTVSHSDRLELALLWLDVVIQAGRGGVNLVERRNLITGTTGKHLLSLVATLCRPPSLPPCADEEAAELASLARDIASGALELFGVVCNVCEVIGQDTGDASGAEAGDSGDSDMIISGRGDGSIVAGGGMPALGAGGSTAPLSRREVLSTMCREPALDSHVLRRVVQHVVKALSTAKGASAKPRRLVRLHYYLELLDHMLDHDSPLRTMVMRSYGGELVRAVSSPKGHASVDNGQPLAVIVHDQLYGLASLLM